MSAPAAAPIPEDASDERPESARSQRLGISGYWQLFREGYGTHRTATRNTPLVIPPAHTCARARCRYDELVKAIIRPPRAEYGIEELGPAQFDLAGVTFVRDDFELQNKRALTLHCSMWRRQESPEGGAPCVIYLHGNASCRAEALQACMHGCCRG